MDSAEIDAMVYELVCRHPPESAPVAKFWPAQLAREGGRRAVNATRRCVGHGRSGIAVSSDSRSARNIVGERMLGLYARCVARGIP